MELMIALVLFVAIVACWLVLPGSTSTKAAANEQTRPEAKPDMRGAARHAA